MDNTLKIVEINGFPVLDLGRFNAHSIIALALDSDNFTIESEQEADYGRLTIYHLSEGFYARLLQVSENWIDAIYEEEGRWSKYYVRTTDMTEGDYMNDEPEEAVHRLWQIEIYEDQDYFDEREDDQAA